jgi:diguanylate cyclase
VAATVLKHADTAMYQAKAGASGAIVMYTAAMSARLRNWLDLEGRLRRAVQEDKLELHYQPKFRLSDNRLVGVEALLRWCDAEPGEIPPTRFIEIAEDSGLIIDLGAWVIRAVCRQLRAWQDAGHSVPVAINVSGKELLHGDPAWTLEAEARAAGVPISLIEVEMTESVLVKDSARVRTALERLRQLGCRIALDDFGTGYSSLAGWNGCVSEAATRRRASCYRSPCRCASSNRDFCGRPTCPRDTDCACRLAVSQAFALISSRSGLDLVETKLGVLQ